MTSVAERERPAAQCTYTTCNIQNKTNESIGNVEKRSTHMTSIVSFLQKRDRRLKSPSHALFGFVKQTKMEIVQLFRVMIGAFGSTIQNESHFMLHQPPQVSGIAAVAKPQKRRYLRDVLKQRPIMRQFERMKASKNFCKQLARTFEGGPPPLDRALDRSAVLGAQTRSTTATTGPLPDLLNLKRTKDP